MLQEKKILCFIYIMKSHKKAHDEKKNVYNFSLPFMKKSWESEKIAQQKWKHFFQTEPNYIITFHFDVWVLREGMETEVVEEKTTSPPTKVGQSKMNWTKKKAESTWLCLVIKLIVL